MSDEDEILRTTGLSDQARVRPMAQASTAKSRQEALSQPGARKAVDIRVSHSVVRKVPAGELANPGQTAEPAGLAGDAELPEVPQVPKRVAIIYKRKAGHVFAERLVTIIDETQAMRDRFESLPERI
ncbi:MAG: hypothetical protein QNL96_13520 [SAR86 cluster bacterium]